MFCFLFVAGMIACSDKEMKQNGRLQCLYLKVINPTLGQR